MTSDVMRERLAIDGGTPALPRPQPAMFPGGMRIGEEEAEAVLAVMHSKRLFRYYGPTEGDSQVSAFEHAFARKLNVRHALGVASGTSALEAGLVALGVGPGDEVIIPGYTWISTPAAVRAVGATPVIAEIDESLTIDPDDLKRKITPRTRVVIPVHMRGAPADMNRIEAAVAGRDIKILEDAAQAMGATFNGRALGSIGHLGAFSLQFNKIITTGEGGVVATSDTRLYERTLLYHDVAASLRSDLSDGDWSIGTNARMSEIQGAIGLVQLGKLDAILADTRRNTQDLIAALGNTLEEYGAGQRTINDPVGDAGIAFVFFAVSASGAQRAARELVAEGARATCLFDPGVRDYHVAYHWDPILDHRTRYERGTSERAMTEDQRAGLCPRSLEILGRAVHLDISPDLEPADIDGLSRAVKKVLAASAQRTRSQEV
jgi:dTDP-4-amino-4,6-dideoxygalactose transaminase